MRKRTQAYKQETVIPLLRTDDGSGDEILVARALLPEAIDVGAALHYEMFTYSMP